MCMAIWLRCYGPVRSVNSHLTMLFLSEYDLGEDDVDEFLASLDRQLLILDATVHHRAQFEEVVSAQDQLRLVHLVNWAGLGAVQ